MDYIKFNLLSVDAIKEPEGYWAWDNAYFIERDICIQESEITPRKIAKMLRKWGYLTEQSKGKIKVDMHPETMSWFIEILDASNDKPILALSTIH